MSGPLPLTAVVALVLSWAALGAPRAIGAQAASPASARDSAVVAVERSIWEHVKAGNWEGVNAILAGALTGDDKGVYTWTAGHTQRLRDMGCTLTSFAMRDVLTRDIAADVVGLAYRAELSLACGNATPSIVNNYTSVYRRRGSGWELMVTSITPVARGG